jgi:rare lipoprotein A
MRRPKGALHDTGDLMGIAPRGQTTGRIALSFALAGLCAGVASCGAPDKFARMVDPRYGVESSPRVANLGDPVPKGGGAYRVGKPYQVAGRMYVPEDDQSYAAEGLASWYGSDFHGRRTANGETYDMEGLSAAHPTLPMPSYIRITNLRNQRSIILRVNDRGPYHGNRVIDVSKRAAHLLDFHGHGVARVRVEYVGRASLDGSDDHLLAATLREGEPAPAPSMVRLASAKPFLPQGEPRSPVLRADVPLPAERPYTLGQDGDAPAYTGGESQVAGSPRSLNEQAQTLRATGASMLRPSISTGRADSTVVTHNLY